MPLDSGCRGEEDAAIHIAAQHEPDVTTVITTEKVAVASSEQFPLRITIFECTTQLQQRKKVDEELEVRVDTLLEPTAAF